MEYIRKFFDVQTPEAPGTTSAAPAEPINIASIMAKHGVKSDSDREVEIPNIITEKKEEPKTEKTTPAETATVASTEKANSETPPPKEEPKVAEPQKETPPKAPSWQEVLRQQQPDTVLKELFGFDDDAVKFTAGLKGLDPKMVAFLQHWQDNKGDVTAYLRELSTDYSKMSAEEVMRHQLRTEYPKASAKALDALFKKEVVQAYNLDSDDPEAVEEGRLLLEAKADKYRDGFTQNQQKYLLPKPQEPKVSDADLHAQEQKKNFEAYETSLKDNSFTKNMIANKYLSIGEGDDKYNYPISDPNALINTLLDGDSYAKSFFTKETKPNGEVVYTPDVEKQLIVAAVLNDYKGFIRDLGKHFKALGGKAAIEPIENASKPDKGTAAQAEKAPATIAEAMAKKGKLV